MPERLRNYQSSASRRTERMAALNAGIKTVLRSDGISTQDREVLISGLNDAFILGESREIQRQITDLATSTLSPGRILRSLRYDRPGKEQKPDKPPKKKDPFPLGFFSLVKSYFEGKINFK